MEKIVDDRLEENIITITRASKYHNQVIPNQNKVFK
jgi:hypothetical protein